MTGKGARVTQSTVTLAPLQVHILVMTAPHSMSNDVQAL